MSTPTYSLRSTLRNYHDRNLQLMEADEFRTLQQKVQRFSPDATAPLAVRLLHTRVQNEVERRQTQLF
ncbi:hypothetical protein [Hymenobacter koreensis]|uniref:Uncharacterized protein n=1 Tax=Hymenobacter koreensis TaxID=1084523 RepID=A0ABP8JNC5_9BACT